VAIRVRADSATVVAWVARRRICRICAAKTDKPTGARIEEKIDKPIAAKTGVRTGRRTVVRIDREIAKPAVAKIGRKVGRKTVRRNGSRIAVRTDRPIDSRTVEKIVALTGATMTTNRINKRRIRGRVRTCALPRKTSKSGNREPGTEESGDFVIG